MTGQADCVKEGEPPAACRTDKEGIWNYVFQRKREYRLRTV